MLFNIYQKKEEKMSDNNTEHFNSHKEARSSCPYTMPTIFLSLEAIAFLLCLYIVNLGEDIGSWNKLIVSTVFIYFMYTSVRRYLRVIDRSKIRCTSDSSINKNS